MIVGYYRSGGIEQHGFMRKADGTIISFDPTGATETVPAGINSAGVIVGTENAPNGIYHGFLVQIAQ